MEKPNASIDHPAPRRHRLNGWQLAAALFGAPLAWIAQMNLNEMLSGNACSADALHTPQALREHLHGWLAVLNLGCFTCGIICASMAWAAWLDTRSEHRGGEKHAIETGEGRARFLAMLGAMSSTLFMVAIVFTACAFLLVAPC